MKTIVEVEVPDGQFCWKHVLKEDEFECEFLKLTGSGLTCRLRFKGLQDTGMSIKKSTECSLIDDDEGIGHE